MKSKNIANIAIFEEIIVFVSTLLLLYMKVYAINEMSWWALLYPIGIAVGINVILLILSFVMLIIGAFNKKNYINGEDNEERV